MVRVVAAGRASAVASCQFAFISRGGAGLDYENYSTKYITRTAKHDRSTDKLNDTSYSVKMRIRALGFLLQGCSAYQFDEPPVRDGVQPEVSMSLSSRLYHQQRSLAEIEAAMKSDVSGASSAHFRLAEMHLERCANCDPQATIECRGCLLTHVCYRRHHLPEPVHNPERTRVESSLPPVLRIVARQGQ
jgi:hypothetical protein